MHLHVLWLDGVYGWEPGRGQPEFHAQPEVNDADVQQLVQWIRDRVLRALRKAGKWVDRDAAAEGGDGAGDELLPALAAAAVEGRAALGGRAGQRDGRVGRDGRWEPLVKGPLCAEVDGFSLHAGAWVSARDREKLEKLCRYAARPAVAESRLVGAVAPTAVQVPTGPDGCGSAPGSLVSLDALPLVWLPDSKGQSVITCLVSRAHESNDEKHASEGERRRAGCCRCIGRGDLVAVLVDGTIGQ